MRRSCFWAAPHLIAYHLKPCARLRRSCSPHWVLRLYSASAYPATSSNKKDSRSCLFSTAIVLRSGGGRRFAFRSRLARVFLLEFFYAAGRVDDLLLARIERMALGAHFNVQVFAHGRARLELAAATADDVYLFVFGVNFCSHWSVLASNAGAKK